MGMYSRSYIEELLGQHGVEKGCPYVRNPEESSWDPPTPKRVKEAQGQRIWTALHAPYTHNVAFELRMVDLVQSCFLTALAHLPASTMDGCLPTFCAPKAGRLGTACWPIVFSLILRPSNLCFRC